MESWGGSWGRRKHGILGRGSKGLWMLSSMAGVAPAGSKAGCIAEPRGWPLMVEETIKA